MGRNAKRIKRLGQNICPEHGKMEFRNTSYGGLWRCETSGCTVRCWAGSTSTPADKVTRDARIAAHEMFDGWWHKARVRRGTAYKQLAEYLRLPQDQTHIGMFDAEQCRDVIAFVRAQVETAVLMGLPWAKEQG